MILSLTFCGPQFNDPWGISSEAYMLMCYKNRIDELKNEPDNKRNAPIFFFYSRIDALGLISLYFILCKAPAADKAHLLF